MKTRFRHCRIRNTGYTYFKDEDVLLGSFDYIISGILVLPMFGAVKGFYQSGFLTTTTNFTGTSGVKYLLRNTSFLFQKSKSNIKERDFCIDGNKKLFEIYTQKIQDRISKCGQSEEKEKNRVKHQFNPISDG